MKLPHPAPAQEHVDVEAPTQKRSVPAELREPHVTTYVTTKLRKVEIDQLLLKEREKSGMRTAVSMEDVERFERREQRETIPAPPEAPQLPDEVADLGADNKR